MSKMRKALEDAAAALQPFSNAVFNDNWDMTVDASMAKYDDYVRAYKVLRRGRAALAEPEWRPIESALMDHFPVLTWSIQQGRAVAFLDATWSWWSIPNGGGPMEFAPTHWMPLPPPPSVET